MKTIQSILVAIAGLLIGVAIAPAKVTTKTVEVPVERIVVKEVAGPIDTTERDSLRVQVAQLEAELLKARQRPEAPAKAAECGTVAAVPSVVPYQPRRRLFGRFR